MTYTEKILDLTNNEETIRNYTKSEIDDVEKAIKEGQAIAQEFAAKALAKAALLEKLGITSDEAALLLS